MTAEASPGSHEVGQERASETGPRGSVPRHSAPARGSCTPKLGQGARFIEVQPPRNVLGRGHRWRRTGLLAVASGTDMTSGQTQKHVFAFETRVHACKRDWGFSFLSDASVLKLGLTRNLGQTADLSLAPSLRISPSPIRAAGRRQTCTFHRIIALLLLGNHFFQLVGFFLSLLQFHATLKPLLTRVSDCKLYQKRNLDETRENRGDGKGRDSRAYKTSVWQGV